MPSPSHFVATGRLAGEVVSLEHAAMLHRTLYADPAVMATLGGQTRTLEEVRKGLERSVAHWEEHGIGTWAFRHWDTGRFAGLGGLHFFEIEEGTVPGLIYHIPARAWGQGLATEIARAAIWSGFQNLPSDIIYSWTLPQNVASQRVMEKCGLTRFREGSFRGWPQVFFRLDRTHLPCGRHRPAGRVILLDPEDRILLMRARVGENKEVWITPGGGCKPGEGPPEAARRELCEETGIELGDRVPCVWHRIHSFVWEKEQLALEEWYYLCRLQSPVEVPPRPLDPVEAQWVLELRWWTPGEIEESRGILFAPRNLRALLPPLRRGELPHAPVETGV
jgi:RimJ/RimL family protein N-acetyltransferase/8-oxo-dGTP pyrophosphatase MutT (NUDIX family)